jgi:hypothetical protein
LFGGRWVVERLETYKQDLVCEVKQYEAKEDWSVWHDGKLIDDWERIGTRSEFVVLPRRHKQKEEHDCWSLYKHSDETYTWRPCMVKHHSGQLYSIEFKHLPGILLKRQQSEILFSVAYARH